MNEDTVKMITNGQARRIASEWHGGQGSSLYSFASSGAIGEWLRAEIATEIAALNNRIEGTGETNALRLALLMEDRRDLLALDRYASEHGQRGPVDGWYKLWDDTEVTLAQT